MRKLPVAVTAVVVYLLFAVSGAFAQGYPMPRAAGSANDSCAVCTGNYTGLPTYPYSMPPVKAFKGRFVDSVGTRDFQQPIRTYRARKAEIASDVNRVYMMIGSSFFSWDLSTFFTSKIGSPMTGPPVSRSSGGELYLAPDASFYAEKNGWLTPIIDGQDRLYDMDWDDRGNVYLAYTVFGWGILRENGTGYSTQKQIQGSESPSAIAVLKFGSRYIAYIGADDAYSVYDVTTATAPTKLVGPKSQTMGSVARTASRSHMAVVNGLSSMLVFSANQLSTGSPSTITADSGGLFTSVTSDGTYFWVGEHFPVNDTWMLWKIDPATSSIEKYAMPGTGMQPASLEYGSGLIGVTGTARSDADTPSSDSGSQFHIFDVTKPAGPTPVDGINDFMRAYYVYPPAGFARPPGYSVPYRLTPYTHDGKTYMVYSGLGLGDVYEIRVGDTLSATQQAGPWGSQNPDNPNRANGPYYGDTASFKSTFSGAVPPTVSWNFGNPESADNTTTAASGDTVTHRFKNLGTTAGAVGATRTVTATSMTDSSISGSASFAHLVPSARVLLEPLGATFPGGDASPLPIVLSDQFSDASDGTVEGHYSEWAFDGTPSMSVPTTPLPVGNCGTHTLSFKAHYKSYTASTSIIPSAETDFVQTVNGLQYNARPFAAKAQVGASTSTTVTITNGTRVSATGISPGATWIEKWELLNGIGTVVGPPQESAAVSFGTITNFVVNKSQITTGSKVRLTITAQPGAFTDSACDPYAVSLAEVLLIAPDPRVNTTQCTNPTTAGGCTLTADSIAGNDQAGWTYQWKLDGSPVSGATSRSFTPTFTETRAYTASVTATNSIGANESTGATLNVTTPPCFPAPKNVNFAYSTVSGRTIKFESAPAFQYTYQPCDSFSWTFGDGQTGTGQTLNHTYSADGTYSVKMTVSNSNGSASETKSVTVGTPLPPPPPCPSSAPKQGGIFVGYTGPASGCKPAGKDCYAGENITFKTETFQYTVQSCDSASWTWGDGTTGSGFNTSHAYSQNGTYSVTLKVTNSKGSATHTGTVKVVANPTTVCNAPASDLKIDWLGLTSGCKPSDPSKSCKQGGETVRVRYSSASGYTLQSCDSVSWQFGDGQSSTSKTAYVDHTYSAPGSYTVGVTITNSKGTISDSGTIVIPAAIPKPVVTIDAPKTTASAGATLSFVGNAQSDALITGYNWRIFKDTSTTPIYSVANEGGISYTFETEGTYTVEFTASNAGGVSTPAVVVVTITPANQFAFLLPVVAHLEGQNGTRWRTDLQIFNTDPDNVPITLNFEFRGGSTTIVKSKTIDASTKVYEDLLTELVSPFTLNDAGPVIVRGQSNHPPQMWTKTYTVDAAGIGSYGQFIPAVPIDLSQPSAPETGAYVVPGLEISSRFRTNLGLVNPSSQPLNVSVTATDDSTVGLVIGQFTIEVGGYALRQLGDLSVRIPGLANGRPFSLRISATNDAPLVVYGSMIDQKSNDPVYVAGVHEPIQASPDMQTQVIPGAGRLEQANGTWRSDVVVYNDDPTAIRFDLSYYDSKGLRVAEAKDQVLAAGAFVRVEDILRWPLLDKTPPDSFGIVKLETTSAGVTRYPIAYERTYKDRGNLGTFGQGIPAISPQRPNVKAGSPAYIAGVRSDTSYYTNLGLVALGTEPSRVRVSLLDEVSGLVVGMWENTTADGVPSPIAQNVSLIAPNIVRVLSPTATQGTLRVEILEGGPVWAYASVIAGPHYTCNCTLPEHTFDPEYIPAVAIGE